MIHVFSLVNTLVKLLWWLNPLSWGTTLTIPVQLYFNVCISKWRKMVLVQCGFWRILFIGRLIDIKYSFRKSREGKPHAGKHMSLLAQAIVGILGFHWMRIATFVSIINTKISSYGRAVLGWGPQRMLLPFSINWSQSLDLNNHGSLVVCWFVWRSVRVLLYRSATGTE